MTTNEIFNGRNPTELKEQYFDLLRLKNDYETFLRVISKQNDIIYNSRLQGLDILLSDKSLYNDVTKALNPDLLEFKKKIEIFESINDGFNRELSTPDAQTVLRGTQKILKYEKNLDNLHPDIISFLAEKGVLDIYGVSFPIRNFTVQQMEYIKSQSDIILSATKDRSKLKESLDYATNLAIAQLSNRITGIMFQPILDCKNDPLSAFLYIRQASGVMSMAESNIFSNVSVRLSSYYPKSELALENLDSLLVPGYELNENNNQKFKVIKLGQGNKDDRSKIKSKVMIENGSIALKYMAFGVYGEKTDIVLKFNEKKSQDALGLHHLDYGGLEFKTYTDDQTKLFLGEEERDEEYTTQTLSSLLDKSPYASNHFFIREGSSVKFNTAGIGGEALKYTCDFIEKNYFDILKAANK